MERPIDLSRWQAQYPDRIAPAIPMTRGALHWRLTVPDDGSLPAWPGEATHAGDGLFPTLIQWDVPNHPAISLPRQDLALRRLRGSHPQAELLRQGLAWIGAADLIEIEQTDGPPQLVAEIDTPSRHQDPALTIYEYPRRSPRRCPPPPPSVSTTTPTSTTATPRSWP